ncbi:MAG: hypothetical protein ABR881_17815 [Candidatus Sulfotelmatobacter sp.]|jgi:hypothetical protein
MTKLTVDVDGHFTWTAISLVPQCVPWRYFVISKEKLDNESLEGGNRVVD